jgi:hypothetical protein
MSPILISYINERMQPDVVEGESWKKLDSDSPRLGTINLKSLSDGHQIIVNKSAIAKVEVIPQAVWDEGIKKQEEQREAQKKAQEEQRKANDLANRRDQIKKWNAQPWFKKIGRHCPVTLPADLVQEAPKA